MLWLILAAASLSVFLAMERSVLVPVAHSSTSLEYLFVGPSVRELTLCVAAGACIAGALWLWTLGMAARRGDVTAARRGRWMAPLLLPALTLLSGGAFALPSVGAAFVFVGHDLRWWVIAVALLLLVRALRPVVGLVSPRWVPSARGWSATGRTLGWEALLFVTAIAWAYYTMPVMRFAGEPHGDEPKYLRYIENWYQGNGFDLRPKQRMSDMRLDEPSRLSRNLLLAARAAGEETRAMVSDIGAFASDPGGFQWNRARGGENWFLIGKRGGLYQVHTPGQSLLLLPGYTLDRHFLDLKSGHQGEVPAQLLMTNLTVLLLYAVWAVVLFHLFRRVFEDDRMAAGLSALSMLALPATSFAFQLYPETSAGIALAGTLIFVLFPRADERVRRAVLFGAMCGFLPWLHIRFSLVSAVVLLAALAWPNRRVKHRLAFAAGYAMVIAVMCAYAYRLTGSPFPTAMFDAPGTAESFNADWIPEFFAGYLVDRIWGVIPHAPIYLLAFLGLGYLWRANRAHFALIVGIYLALAVPAAAHSLNAAAATPGRHITAVLPLLFWPIGLAARAWWPSRVFRTAFWTLVLLTLHAAFTYNWFHTKDFGRFWDEGISGWKLNLLFAWLHSDPWEHSQGNFVLFLIWAAVAVALLAAGFLARPRVARKTASLTPLSLAVALVFVAAAGAGAAALTGDQFRDDYEQDPILSRRMALQRLAEIDRCVICASSTRGEIDEGAMTWNPLEKFDVFVEVDATRTAHLRVVVTSTRGEPAFGRVRIDYGNGDYSASLPVAGVRRLTYQYRQPGTYRLTARVTMPDGSRHETFTEVEVR